MLPLSPGIGIGILHDQSPPVPALYWVATEFTRFQGAASSAVIMRPGTVQMESLPPISYGQFPIMNHIF
jgi:hypothetical protein